VGGRRPQQLEALRTTTVFAYRFDADRFRPLGLGGAALVSTEPVTPLGPPEPVGDLLRCHAEAGIQLRVLPNLWDFWDQVIVSTLDFSGIRLANALPPRG
jgi:hypothetical protein